MRKTIYTGLLALAAVFASCDDYLSKKTNEGGDEVLNRSEQIDAIFANSEKMLMSYARYNVSSSDDFGWTTSLMDQISYPDNNIFNGIVWDIDGIAGTNTGDEVWSNEYERIFYANLIINEIDQVTDLTDDKRANYLAQAHFLRALANWELVCQYCRPYSEETLSSPGLPLKQTTNYEENQTRASLEDTYKFIESDLLEAMSTTRTDIDKRWLVSKPAVAAMLSRFYLFTCDYEKAEQYADEALKSGVAQLIDYNTLTHIERDYGGGGGYDDYDYYSEENDDYYDEEGGYSEEEGGEDGDNEPAGTTLSFPEFYGYSSAEYTELKEFYFSTVYMPYESAYLYPSETLLNLYDKDNDLRFDQFFVKGAMQTANNITVDNDYCYYAFQHEWRGPIMIAGPTVAEALLNKAEAQARQGDYTNAMQTVNLLRAKRMRTGSEGIELTASTQQEAVMQILDERHREMPFMMRWQDIRRLAYNETTYDDISLTREFYVVNGNNMDTEQTKTYTLPVKSPRYAQPINNLEIKRSGNQLVQNEY